MRAGSSRAMGIAVSVILLYAFLNPMLSAYTPLPELSGSEAAVAVAAWFFSVLATHRIHAIDWIIAGLFTWSMISAGFNDVAVTAAILQAALLASPFALARMVISVTGDGWTILRKTLVFLVLAQALMMVVQFVTMGGVDDMKGTFVGTQYGEHVSSFTVLVGATAYAIRTPRSWKGPAAITVAVLLAYLADSKVALVYFLAVGIVYVLFGTPLSNVRRSMNPLFRVAVGSLGAVLVWAVYTGALGNIALSGYVEQTTETGGGKVAVTQMIVDPDSRLWAEENMIIGAGPAQTVSRTAGLTVPNASSPIPPGSRLGIAPGEYYSAMEIEASGYGYVASSSFTKAASSLLGILGDLGVIGLLIYFAGYFWVYRRVAAAGGSRSWPALAWLLLVIPGFIGEWLEFPPATMFLAALTLWLVLTQRREAAASPISRLRTPAIIPRK